MKKEAPAKEDNLEPNRKRDCLRPLKLKIYIVSKGVYNDVNSPFKYKYVRLIHIALLMESISKYEVKNEMNFVIP